MTPSLIIIVTFLGLLLGGVLNRIAIKWDSRLLSHFLQFIVCLAKASIRSIEQAGYLLLQSFQKSVVLLVGT